MTATATRPRALNKSNALLRYQAAATLRYVSTLDRWKSVFPDAAALVEFWEAVKGLSWPGSYGSAPWEAACNVAGYIAAGTFAPSTLAFYERQLARPDPCPFDQGLFAILTAYGFQVPDSLKA